jgi:pimeloyl-ACP methyl ester carboxylesterase
MPIDTYVTAQDGLKLHVRQWGRRAAPGLPVVCLPGLTRSVADFEVLAPALAADARAPRRVLALSSRGRGKSQYDPKAENYSLQVELADLLAVLTALEVAPSVFVGTSRGGLLSMLLAVARPTVIAGCVLNDIGPVLESQGLARIKSYVGKLSPPASWQDAADGMRNLFGAQFTRLSAEEWLAFARRTFKEEGTRIVPDYDARIATALADMNLEKPVPTMWKEFDALAGVPILVVRGANSDLLSTATVAEMQRRHPHIKSIEVPDQGHAPLLRETPVIEQIAELVRSCEARYRSPH